MRFNPTAFDTFLGGIGQRVTWRRAYSCACVNPNSGAPDPKHSLCSGKGKLWSIPVETVTGVASQTATQQWMQSGQYETGDMVLSIPQNSVMWDAAGQFDRIVMLNSNDIFSLPLKHGAPSERLLFTVQTVSRCFWLDPTTRLIIEGGLPVIDASGNPSWPGGIGEPPPGMTYSLTGQKYDEYFVWGRYPSDRNEHSGMRLPKRLVARKWDLFNRGLGSDA